MPRWWIRRGSGEAGTLPGGRVPLLCELGTSTRLCRDEGSVPGGRGEGAGRVVNIAAPVGAGGDPAPLPLRGRGRGPTEAENATILSDAITSADFDPESMRRLSAGPGLPCRMPSVPTARLYSSVRRMLESWSDSLATLSSNAPGCWQPCLLRRSSQITCGRLGDGGGGRFCHGRQVWGDVAKALAILSGENPRQVIYGKGNSEAGKVWQFYLACLGFAAPSRLIVTACGLR